MEKTGAPKLLFKVDYIRGLQHNSFLCYKVRYKAGGRSMVLEDAENLNYLQLFCAMVCMDGCRATLVSLKSEIQN